MDNTGAGRLDYRNILFEITDLPYYLNAANFYFKEVFYFMKKNFQSAAALTECAVMIALAAVLSLIKIVDLPAGGSVTVASMLPIAIVAYRHGIGYGFLSATIYGLLQQLLGLSALSYVSTWQSIVAVIFLDYIVAFAVIGLAGIFRKVISHQALAICFGCFFVCLLRYACHVIAGATVWAGLSIPSEAAMIYSLSYNATYMIPEAIILLVISAYVGSNINFESKRPSRMSRASLPQNIRWISPVSGLIIVGAIIADTLLIFPKLQNVDSGEFDIGNLVTVNWTLVVMITAVALLIIASLFAIRGVLYQKSKT